MPFEHSFLSGGNDFSVFLHKSFYQHSLLYQSMLLEGVDVVCQTYSFIILHCSVIPYHWKKLLYPYSPLWEGIDFIFLHTYIYIHTFISRILSIILHASLIPNFRKCHSTIHSFLEGMISLYIWKVSSIIVHCSINPCFWEGVDVACQTFLLSSCIALSLHTTRKKLRYPCSLLWEGADFISIYRYMSFKNLFYHPSCFSHSKL